MHDPPTFGDVVAAASRLQGHAHTTPIFTSRTIDEELGAQVFSSAGCSQARRSRNEHPG